MSWFKIRPEREAQGESGGHQTPPTGRCSMEGCYATPSSEISDGGGVAARREGSIPVEAGKVQPQLKPRDRSAIIVGTLAVRSGWGVLSRTA